MVGVYKLEIQFGKFTQFVTKVEIGERDRLNAAVIVDHYYAQKLNNTNEGIIVYIYIYIYISASIIYCAIHYTVSDESLA